MIRGIVNDNDEPILPITLILKRTPQKYQAVIDTGFNGYLSVPEVLVHQSRWFFAGYEEYEIATGKKVEEQVYLGRVIFDHVTFVTHVVASRAGDILIGTKLLSNKTLHIDFRKRLVWIK